MAAGPFPNSYVCRKVAAADSRACAVCYKPTVTVLVAENGADFFYVCESHLKDSAFAEPVHAEEYTAMHQERSQLETAIRAVDQKASMAKSYAWSKVMNVIGWDSGASRGRGGDSQESEDGKDGADSKVTESDEKDAKVTSSKTTTYEDLVKERKDLARKVAQLNESIASFRFKKYKLDTDVYRIRLNTHIQAQTRAKRHKELHSSGFFPLAPSHELS